MCINRKYVYSGAQIFMYLDMRALSFRFKMKNFRLCVVCVDDIYVIKDWREGAISKSLISWCKWGRIELLNVFRRNQLSMKVKTLLQNTNFALENYFLSLNLPKFVLGQGCVHKLRKKNDSNRKSWNFWPLYRHFERNPSEFWPGFSRLDF